MPDDLIRFSMIDQIIDYTKDYLLGKGFVWSENQSGRTIRKYAIIETIT